MKKTFTVQNSWKVSTLTPCQPARSPTARRKSAERVVSVSLGFGFVDSCVLGFLETRMAEEAPVATLNTSAVVSMCFT